MFLEAQPGLDSFWPEHKSLTSPVSLPSPPCISGLGIKDSGSSCAVPSLDLLSLCLEELWSLGVGFSELLQ